MRTGNLSNSNQLVNSTGENNNLLAQLENRVAQTLGLKDSAANGPAATIKETTQDNSQAMKQYIFQLSQQPPSGMKVSTEV